MMETAIITNNRDEKAGWSEVTYEKKRVFKKRENITVKLTVLG